MGDYREREARMRDQDPPFQILRLQRDYLNPDTFIEFKGSWNLFNLIKKIYSCWKERNSPKKKMILGIQVLSFLSQVSLFWRIVIYDRGDDVSLTFSWFVGHPLYEQTWKGGKKKPM